MNYSIELKNVQPLVVLTHLDKRYFSDLEQTSYELYNVAEAGGRESLFCMIEEPRLGDDVEIKVCCPIQSVDLVYHEKKYKIEVLPRALVLSVVHSGEYDQLKPVFEEMFRYIHKNNLNTSIHYRILFHREKREWDRTSPNQRPNADYITEVQIQLFDR